MLTEKLSTDPPFLCFSQFIPENGCPLNKQEYGGRWQQRLSITAQRSEKQSSPLSGPRCCGNNNGGGDDSGDRWSKNGRIGGGHGPCHGGGGDGQSPSPRRVHGGRGVPWPSRPPCAGARVCAPSGRAPSGGGCQPFLRRRHSSIGGNASRHCPACCSRQLRSFGV